MQEVLANTEDPRKPLCEQQFYELTLTDPDPGVCDAYLVRQVHARWEERVADIVWDEVQRAEFANLAQAREGYERRRKALVSSGFRYSDLDY